MRLQLAIPLWFQGALKNVFGPPGGGAPPVQQGFFGSKATDGGGNWGPAVDRAMGNIFTVANTATLKRGFQYYLPGGSGTCRIKMLIYSVVGGEAGTLLATSSIATNTGAGLTQVNFNNEVIPAGQVYILTVSEGAVGGAGWDMGSFNSGGQPAAKIYNGTVSFASPPATAPAPTTQYNNGLSCYVEYEY